MTLTPYDTGQRLEPRPWLVQHRATRDDFGKVDFDNEESATQAIVYIEKNQDQQYHPGYTLRAYNMGPEPLRLALEEEDRPAVVIQPVEALRTIVEETIAGMDPAVREEVEIYYSPNNHRALLLISGEEHVRKQLLIYLTDVGDGEPSSAYVKSWTTGIRETRL